MRTQKQPRDSNGRFASFRSTAKKAATKKTARTSVKKTAAKKTQTLTKKVTPLKDFAGYRLSGRRDRVRFGCGEVQVLRKDLLELAKLQDQLKGYNEAIRRRIELVSKLAREAGTRYSYNQIMEISPETLIRLAATPIGGC